MTEQQMPARIWTGSEVPPDWNYWGAWSIEKDQEDISYIRADIAERMAEALEGIVAMDPNEHGKQGIWTAQRIARSALSAFRSATQDTEARHD